MSRADDIRARAEAEARVAELEDELIAAKDTAEGPDRDLKDQLRAARQEYRELRAAEDPGPGVARPDVIAATAAVKEI